MKRRGNYLYVDYIVKANKKECAECHKQMRPREMYKSQYYLGICKSM